METGPAPKQKSDAQNLHALVDELRLVHGPSVLDSGAVLFNGAVLLLPKHRCCCAGSCYGVEHRDIKEIRDHKEVQDNQETQESRHSLEGLWSGGSSFFLIYTVQAKPGYLFGTILGGKYSKQVVFWFRSGDGGFKDVLEGKWFNRTTSTWEDVKLYWNSNNSIRHVWSGGSSYEYMRLQMDQPLTLPVGA